MTKKKERTPDEEAELRAIGSRIAQAREAKGYSTLGLANKMGLTKGAVGHWETGKNAVRALELAALCRTLGVSSDEILFGVRRWPFEKVDFDLVNDLEASDLGSLQGAMLQTARDLGVEIRRISQTPTPIEDALAPPPPGRGELPEVSNQAAKRAKTQS